MKFKLDSPANLAAATGFIKSFKGDTIVEIKKVNPTRSSPQNRYLHLLLGAFGSHFRYSLEESKLIYKELNKDIYSYEKKGRTFLKSSANLTTEEMAKSVDVFRNKSAEVGYPLPLATDEGWLMEVENAMEQARSYL